MAKQKQTRPVAEKTGKSKIGEDRYNQIKGGIYQYNKALKEGFYIEAIALMESAISDRMESTLNYLYPYMDYSFGTIGRLADSLMKTECFSKRLLTDIKEWARKRNDAIHQMVKLLPDNDKSFQERYEELKECAEEGKRLFRRLDNEKRKITRFQDSHPLVYTLKDPERNVNGYPEVLRIKCKVMDMQKLQNGVSYDQTRVQEAENGILWRKQLLDMYYDLEKT